MSESTNTFLYRRLLGDSSIVADTCEAVGSFSTLVQLPLLGSGLRLLAALSEFMVTILLSLEDFLPPISTNNHKCV